MGRPRTGTLEMRGGTFHTRIMVGTGEEARRELYDLGTADERLAKLKRAHLLKTVAKAPPSEAPTREHLRREVSKAETFETVALRLMEKRRARGIVSAPEEEGNLRRYVFPFIGDRPMTEGAITTAQIEAMLEAAVACGLAQETIRKIRAVTNRVFKAALREDGTRLKTNPVANTEAPKVKTGRKRVRAIPTDEELRTYFGCDKVDPELQMMVLAARVEGGMRTGDVIRWDWVDIDTVDFATCTIPRSKTDSPQVLGIPQVLAAALCARWQAAGKPTTGPVFPVQRGPRKGQMRSKRGISFAKRFRRDLRRAGILRRELFTATERTLPVDFHSLRRAFVTKLAVAGINVQTAMALANHTDHRTHLTYIGADPALQEIPASVVSFGSSTKTPLLGSGNSRATQDSNLRPLASEAVVLLRSAAQSSARNGNDVNGLRGDAGANRRNGFGTKGSPVLVRDGAREALADATAGLVIEATWWSAADAWAANDLLDEAAAVR